MLSSVFPAINFNPDLYYALLEDLREDAFIGGVTKICRDCKELYPNTNLVALVREKAQEHLKDVAAQKVKQDAKRLELQDPNYEEIEKVKGEWNELKERLAKTKGIKPEGGK